MPAATRTDEVTRELRGEILRGRFRPGERLPSERDLAARFDTTRGVARIVLKRLEQLGVATVKQGGARVCPIEEASLEVVGHLVELETPPDPDLVVQILEVVGALVASNVRMVVERASPTRLASALEVVERLRKPGLSDEDAHQLVHDLGDAFMEANDNVVIKIVRRGLRAEMLRQQERMSAALGSLRPGPPVHSPSTADLTPLAERLAQAVEDRDGPAAYEAVHRIWNLFRLAVHAHLTAAREAVGMSAHNGNRYATRSADT